MAAVVGTVGVVVVGAVGSVGFRHESSLRRAGVLAARAREIRFAPTPTEQRLWEALRGGRLGVAFRRQVPIGRYVADFVALDAGLVVEVDGGYHAGRCGADARRDETLRRAGYRVLRLEAELVLRELAVAVERIRAELALPR